MATKAFFASLFFAMWARSARGTIFYASKSGADIRVRVIVIRVRVRKPKARKTDAACRPAHHPIVLKPASYPKIFMPGCHINRLSLRSNTKPGADTRDRVIVKRARVRKPKARRVFF